MRLAISNIAWDVTEDEQISRLLHRYRINAIDIAPGKYFPEPIKVTSQEIVRVRDWWAKRGIEITGMQALLFGTIGLNIFGSIKVQESMLRYLSAICRIGARLGATRLVFGSPKSRDRSGLKDEEVVDVAVAFFRRLGDIAHSYGVFICLEPNPSCYGANFMTTSVETAFIVECVAHKAIKMQLDTGALTINGEAAATILGNYARLVGHVHASEPDLLPLGNGKINHKKIYTALRYYLPDYLVSIEMIATKSEPHGVSIERALKVAKKYYQPLD